MFARTVRRKDMIHNIKHFSSASNQYVKSNSLNRVANIIMCHKETRNSLSIPMMQQLISKIDEYEKQVDVRVIVLTAEGPIFSAGHNLKELSPEKGPQQHDLVFSLATKLMHKLIDSPLPIIAKIDGLAAAAGCQLVAQCDLAFCSEESTFSTPGANFGIFCSTPGIALTRCVPKMTAMRMLLTGLPISAKEAEEKGLVAKVSRNLDEDVDLVCEAIKSKSRSVIELGKKFYYKQIGTDSRTAYDMGRKVMVDNLQTADGKEGIKSFIEKRKPDWKFK